MDIQALDITEEVWKDISEALAVTFFEVYIAHHPNEKEIAINEQLVDYAKRCLDAGMYAEQYLVSLEREGVIHVEEKEESQNPTGKEGEENETER